MVMENNAATQINEQTMCLCGRIAATRTAWTENNSGRKFLGCSYYGRPDACDYFKWVDPPLLHPRYKSLVDETSHMADEMPMWHTFMPTNVELSAISAFYILNNH
ncbi:GRF-type domain-containing protein [Forsythia ovata]|uniref:GRF-type domain-containing protein n=1 Tax=Forsythia ovata TaxID=205694 RepID=A0ABD1SK60_9LAMI